MWRGLERDELTNFSDYALRMLMFAATAEDRLFTIEEAARAFGVSKTHLNKVANTLTRAGYLDGGSRQVGRAEARPPARRDPHRRRDPPDRA